MSFEAEEYGLGPSTRTVTPSARSYVIKLPWNPAGFALTGFHPAAPPEAGDAPLGAGAHRFDVPALEHVHGTPAAGPRPEASE
jgi:hypothetical protein